MALRVKNLEMEVFCRFAAHVEVEWNSGKSHTDGVKETKASEIFYAIAISLCIFC